MTYSISLSPFLCEVSTSFRFLYYRSAQIPFPTLQHRSFYIFFFIPLKAKRLFFPSFWRWCNFTWSLLHAMRSVNSPPFTYTLLYSSPPCIFIPPPPFPFLIGRGHFMNSTSQTFFLLLLLFFLAKKILRRENLEAAVAASLVYSLRVWVATGWRGGWRGRSRASGRSSRIQLSCGKEFWWEEDLGAGRR